jgi:hypothetical protein
MASSCVWFPIPNPAYIIVGLGVGLCDASAVIQRKMYRVDTAYCVNAVGASALVATRKLRFSCTRCCGLARSSQPGNGQRHKSPRPNIGGLTFWLILALGYGGNRAASPVVMVGERLGNRITGLRTTPVP